MPGIQGRLDDQARASGRASDQIHDRLMARKLRTKRGRAEYARRKAIIEPVFGQIKQCRGFRQFLMRVNRKINAEWKLVCLTHNLLKLFRSQSRATD